MENGPWIHTKNVGLLSALFILLNIIIIIVLSWTTVEVYRYRCGVQMTTPYVNFSIVGVYYFLGTSAYTKRVFLPIYYCTLLLFIGTILTIWPLRISLPSCCWALWTSSDRQWYILDLASGMYNICSLT